MKKNLIVCVAFLLIGKWGISQTVQGTFLPGSASNRVVFAIKASAGFSAPFTNVQFVIQIPNTVLPIPTVSIVNNFLSANIPTYNNSVVNSGTPIAFLNDGTNYNYLFSSAPTGQPAFNFPTTTTPVLEVQITGAPGTASVRFANLPNGGASGQHYFYIEANGLDYTNVAVMFYGPFTANGGSYGTYSNIRLDGVSLPVTFASYDVKCNDKGALLTWSTASEQNSSKFEVQKSVNGTDWKVVGSVTSAGNSSDTRSYQYLDISGGGVAQYRIRQVDQDGRFTYTAIKQTNCKASQFDITLYPVPARDQLTVVLRSDLALKTDLQIIDIGGRTVKRITVQIVKGNNNILLNVSDLPGGQYLLTSSDLSIMINKKFTVIR